MTTPLVDANHPVRIRTVVDKVTSWVVEWLKNSRKYVGRQERKESLLSPLQISVLCMVHAARRKVASDCHLNCELRVINASRIRCVFGTDRLICAYMFSSFTIHSLPHQRLAREADPKKHFLLPPPPSLCISNKLLLLPFKQYHSPHVHAVCLPLLH